MCGAAGSCTSSCSAICPSGLGSLEEARLAARYLGKYAGKALDQDRPAGLHRYEVAQGFKPQFAAHRRGRP